MSERSGALRIVFDFGGVLFNWQPRQLVRRFLPRHATDDESIHALVAAVFQGFGGDWTQFDRGVIDADQLVHRIAVRTGFDADDVAALVAGVPPSLTPKPDTVRMVWRLRAAGVPLHFLSNMPLPYAEHLDRSHPELMSQFESGLYSGRVRLVKPEAALFE
ncbi:MAG TPA: HAD family phosphatase, partial [Burkholderiaceae bacterium]|nr:HAD family phosphatase [Burkholderiaceae bacterium]